MESVRLKRKLELGLLLLRWFSFLVFFMWTVDKLINPDHAAAVFEKFYFLEGIGSQVMFSIGCAELLLIFGFVLGVKKWLTYQLVFIIHLISVLSSYEKYINPWEPGNLLFFAALPMLAGLYVLYMLRDWDNLLTVEGRSSVASKEAYPEKRATPSE